MTNVTNFLFGTDFTDYTVFLDRIYRMIRILFCLSTFPEESLKTKSLREKENGIWCLVVLLVYLTGFSRFFLARIAGRAVLSFEFWVMG